MPLLIIESAMVNPKGKAERLNQTCVSDDLNREWIQIRNIAKRDMPLTNISLHHWVYGVGAKPEKSLLLRFNGALPPYGKMRIHSGHGNPYYDEEKRLYHIFMNQKRNRFLYQIVRPDFLFLLEEGRTIDRATYLCPPPENRRLARAKPIEMNMLQPIKIKQTA